MKLAKLKFFLMGSTLVLLSGCASLSGAESKENLTKLKYGMDQSTVLHLLGEPNSVIHQSQSDDRWIYVFKSRDKKGRNLFVDFRNGELAKTGELSGREVAAAGDDDRREQGGCTRRPHPEVQQESLCLK